MEPIGLSMTVVLLALILFVGVVLAFELVHLGRATPRLPESGQLEAKIFLARKYGPLTRLFSRRDFDFVASNENTSDAPQRLKKRRLRVMKPYLKEVRHDFHRAWSTGRLLAPFSSDPAFGSMLVRQLGLFYSLYFTLQLRTLVGAYGQTTTDIENLVEAVKSLEVSAQQVVRGIRTEAFHASAAA
jgi:hypothetical protein